MTRGLLGGGCRVEPVHGFDVALQQRLDGRRGARRANFLLHEQDGGGELAVLPQVLLVDQHLRAGLEHQAGGPRLGQPGAVELAVLEQLEGLGVLGGLDVHVAAAVGVGLVALLAEPGAQRHVLRAAELRRGERLALEVRRRVDAVA